MRTDDFVRMLIATGSGMRLDMHGRWYGGGAAIHKTKKSANRQIAGEDSKQKGGGYSKNDGRECHERKQTIL